ncbi:two-component sensor histidine kinase [Neisseria subflava]|uniref:sensor histidine kinase n=1 Tax=Neisseria subflava TaxID=28449 RepID=UPI00202A7088|nr:ATP-binding protein [Neisseria subflava]MCL9779329.1 two-component sensor histidine kinase [Neisseria subflava]UTG77139.1 two-component sensor histidine kinase [Neisseria subflava]
MQRLIHTIKQSLQVKISLALICMLLPLSILAGIFSYYDTYHETQEVQDDLLRQVANYLDPSDADDENHSLDNDNKISVQFPNTPNPIVSLPKQISDGLHTIQADDDDDYYRVYTRNTKQGRIAVMQESDYREELAEMAAVQSILPMLLALPLIILLTVWITHRAMRSVKTLSNDLEQRQINDLSPMDTQDIPSEIQGFVVAINNLLQRTDENVRQQQRFIADAAHELRSPMTALSLQAERLNNMQLSAEAREQSALLQQSIQRNRHLLEQLLSLARAQAPETQRPKTLISLQNQFRRVLQELMPLALAKGQDIGVAVENDCQIHADDTEIYTLIKTFADNAIRYTPKGGRIDLGFDETAEYLNIWVEDDGPGIPPSERQRVIDPFYRILGTEQQGTGLGLSIANTIVKRHQGRLKLADSRRFDSGLLIIAELDKKTL